MASQKVLIIDDGKAIRMQVREMLPQGNFEVLEAKDGVEGLDLIRQERPNLILLDFFMPRMNGWEVWQHLQTQPDLKSIPLVIMSGRKEEITEKISDPSKSFEFIEKPFDQKALIGAVKAAMAKAKVRSIPVSKPAMPVSAPPMPANAAVQSNSSLGVTAPSAEVQALKAQIQALNDKTAKMQAEFDMMKKQMGQMMAFIRQKLQ